MATMVISAEFNIGDIVYIKTDLDQHPCIVTGINIRPGHLSYMLTRDDVTGNYYDFEVSVIKNVKVF
jgi:hypothetical protein